LKKNRFQPILLNMSEQENSPLNGLENLQEWYQEKFEENWHVQTSVLSKNYMTMDVLRSGAAKMYRKNWDGCRDLWKSSYRQRKERRISR
jgi:hypothetical protein